MPLPGEQQIEKYKPSEAITKLRQEFETDKVRDFLELADLKHNNTTDLPEDKVKKIIYRLIVEATCSVTVEETSYMLESVKLPEVRESLHEFLGEI